MPNYGLAGQLTHNVNGPTVTGTAAGTGASATLALGSGATLTDKEDAVVRATFDKIIQWKLRWTPMYRNFATRRPVDVAFPGSTITMFRAGATGLALATTPLSQYEDPSAKSLPGLESTNLTMEEYGDDTVTTLRLREQSFTQIDPLQAEYVARAMRDTVDAIYMNAIYASTGGFSNNGFRSYKASSASAIASTTAAASSTYSLTAAHIRRLVAIFRNAGMPTFADGHYLGLITPDISVALREATDVAGWRYPHLEAEANGNLWNGTVGIFENVRFLESPQFQGLDKGTPANPAVALVDQSPADTTAANILFLSSEGLVEGTVREPGVAVTQKQDAFGRLKGIGWYGWFGTSVYDNHGGILFDCKNG